LSSTGSQTQQRHRMLTRAVPLTIIAVSAFVVGVVAASGPDAPAAQRFVDAWASNDFAAMYDELTPDAQANYSLQRFEREYADASRTATIASLTAGPVSEQGDGAVSTVTVDTYVFGKLTANLDLPISNDKIAWNPSMVFPGLASDEQLSRRTRAPARAAILASDRSPLSKGPAAARTVGTAALAVAGEVGTPNRAQARDLALHGFPPATLTGISGLELAFNQRLSGTPGGQLLAVTGTEPAQLAAGRVIATSEPVRGKAVRTNIDPALQESAVTALGSTYGGAAVLDAKNGNVLALAGLAYSAPQPPGSTFKIITATGALDAGIVKLSDEFPVESSNSEIGREIPNAHGELCGGTFTVAFADSCNTVFAPLGARLGGPKLVDTAELYGFNSAPALYSDAIVAAVDPPSSVIPADLNDSVATGESAIGQGEVLATPLEMATVAQTIANKGVRDPTAIARGAGLEPSGGSVVVTSPQTAATMTQLMTAVVNEGTGVAAALPGIQVAGKTGTAELGPAALDPGQQLGPGEDPPQETDAWFTAFAPVNDPKIVVAVMVVHSDGDGGTVAAPIVRQIMAGYFGVS
jgi:penicillin-binding protein A